MSYKPTLKDHILIGGTTIILIAAFAFFVVSVAIGLIKLAWWMLTV